MSATFSVEVPEHEAACVAFPGFIRDDERALTMLGGACALSEALRQPSVLLKCQPRSGDTYAHPLFSSESPSQKLLLKFARKSTAGAAARSDDYEVSAICRMTKMHDFRGLADLQIVPQTLPVLDRTSATCPKANLAETAEPDRSEHKLCVLPALYMQSDTSFNYAYKAYANKSLPGASAWASDSHSAEPAGGTAAPEPPDDLDAPDNLELPDELMDTEEGINPETLVPSNVAFSQSNAEVPTTGVYDGTT